jgi:hypothetical protein
VQALLRKAEVVDKEEGKRYGKDKRGDELPLELAFRESRLKKKREARESLGAEARQEAVQALTSDGIDVYIPPDKMKHTSTLAQVPRGRIPKGLSVADRMRRKLGTKKGRKSYGLRKE